MAIIMMFLFIVPIREIVYLKNTYLFNYGGGLKNE